MFLNVTEAINNSSLFCYMYKHNHICFAGILQLIESGNVNDACTCSPSELFLVQRKNAAKRKTRRMPSRN
ncbi:hypothetical protein CHI08_09335 [Peribacillus simplex]|nr:hypothetical protein CHI08_09335 [Peribacillus simplex]